MGAYLPILLMADETYHFFDFLGHGALRIYDWQRADLDVSLG
jgi:hypothetical protein